MAFVLNPENLTFWSKTLPVHHNVWTRSMWTKYDNACGKITEKRKRQLTFLNDA